MPKTSKDTASQTDHGPVVEWTEEFDGQTVNFLQFREDIDATPLLKGLPDGQCQCPHWGYVLKGSMRFRVGDHEEIFDAGDAFYLAPGHIPVGNAPGTEYLQFSPSEQLKEVADTITRNMQEMQSRAGG